MRHSSEKTDTNEEGGSKYRKILVAPKIGSHINRHPDTYANANLPSVSNKVEANKSHANKHRNP